MPTVTVGNVEITPVLDTAVLMNPRYFAPDHADALLAEYADKADERGLLPMAITCFLIRSAGKTMLVDSGLGNRKRPGYPPGKLDESLRALGVAPGDIDVVINTHLHLDHVGWNTVDAEDGSRAVFFTNATFVFQRTEWDYWMTPERKAAPGGIHLVECVEPLENTGRVRIVDSEAPLDEHITFIPTPGHTPGHVAVGISCAGERAVICGDASHHPSQLLHPEWSPVFDLDPVQSATSRDALFERVIDEKAMWLAGHWEHPGMGRIVRLEGKRQFRAL
jgi:glyoxylase-like metal-dependent hydrolase (beta-lactamase superfamily II)